MNKTAISWTDFSANPLKYRRKADGKVVWGCVKTSPGCAHCYSEALALRWDRGRLFNGRNMEELEPFLDEKELSEMLTRQTCDGATVSGSRVFVGDMTDCFGEWVPDGLLDRLFAVFALRGDVTWQVLTKRAERMRRYFTEETEGDCRMAHIEYAGFAMGHDRPIGWLGDEEVLPNVHLGVSAESDDYRDRVVQLLQTPAAVRFVSYEPALGPLDLTDYLRREVVPCPDGLPGCEVLHLGERRLHWVIAGGESGRARRPCEVEWFARLAAQCTAAAAAFHMKQDAALYPGLQGRIPDALWALKEFPR